VIILEGDDCAIISRHRSEQAPASRLTWVMSAVPTSLAATAAYAQTITPLPSWNEGPRRQAILDFVRVTTGSGSARFVPLEERIVAFDPDGMLWLEQPEYSQLFYCFDRAPVLAKANPKLAYAEPFKIVLSGNQQAIAKLSMHEPEMIVIATLTSMSVDELSPQVKEWLATVRHPCRRRPFTDLTYQPM
jgi:hypothetical protein